MSAKLDFDLHVPDLSRPGSIIALTQCAVCDQTVPQNFAITGTYRKQEEYFCSSACQLIYERALDDEVLRKLREAGL